MPINPNIALGIQQPQPINMLGQMGQMYALKAAKQEIEGGEAVRDFFSQGGDLSTPEGQRQIMTAAPKLGGQLIKQQADIRKTQIDALKDEVALRRDALSNVRTPDDYLAWHDANHTGQIGSFFKSAGINPSRESIMAELAKPGGLERLIQGSALGATKLQQNLMDEARAVKVANIGAAAPLGQLQLARDKDARSQRELELVQGVLTGNATPPVVGNAPMGGGQLGSGTFNIPMGGGAPVTGAVTPSAVTPVAAAPTSVVTKPNVLATQVAPSGTTPAPINALLNPPVGQTGAAPAANRVDEITTQLTQLSKINNPAANQAMERLIKEYNVLNPEGEIKQNASGALVTVNRRTNVATPVLGKDGKPVMGNLPYETAFATTVGRGQGERNEKVVLAAQAAVDNIAKIDSTIELLKTGDATTGLGAELRNNIDRARALFAGDIKAGKKVADTQILDALLGSDVFSMIQSLGIGARGLDTPAERDYLRQVMTGTIQMDNKALIRLSEIRRNIETRAIEKYNTQLEKGDLNKYFETQGLKPEKIEVPKMAGGSNTVSVGGNTYTFPNAEAAAKFKKDAGIK
jgi:hypothetical protein